MSREPSSGLMAKHIVLGIDPGTATMGYGLVQAQGEQLSLIDYGTLTTPATLPVANRLRTLYQELLGLIQRYQPNEVALEELFFNKNIRTALAVGEARGVAMLAAANCGLTVSEYTPLQIKQAIVGYGRARKEQIQQMVRLLLGLDFLPQPDDAADALALAICHLHTTQQQAALEARQGGGAS
ncbi:MAG: crossover junction endodeoxyribonuclease RuvC [Chloroflexi bacterium]|nr:crossover junction endodeoxyribonuclease RuvC [Chloroflexota bacterium]MCL5076463.1 crossover junction endodeoxyribonuclease RuvC [Chloroflexota bacterium]